MKWLAVVALVACDANPSKLDHIAQPGAAAKPELPLVFDAAAVDAWVASQIAERGTTGAALVVVRDGKTVLAKGYGKAVGDVAVTPDTPFALGSVSKQFLCTVAYALADKGQLAMTDPVAKWYPQATRAGDVTLADIGGHTAGYRDYYPLDYVDARMAKPIAPDDLIAQYATMPLDFEPRARWSYSNTGFTILGRVVEKVAGKPYSQLLDEVIFKPLAMTTATTKKPAQSASGHVSFLIDGAKAAPLEAEGWLFGAGDIWASANDVAKWDLAVADGTLLSVESRKALATPRTLTDGRSTNYSCGFGVRLGTETVLQQSGWVGGFHTRNIIIPRTRSAVILLTNDEYTNATDIADRIAQLITAENSAPTMSSPADVAVRDFVTKLQGGTVDRSVLGDDANQYFDDARVRASAAKLAAYGAVTKVKIDSRGERGGLEVTTFTLTFPASTLSGWMFRSPDGKIRQVLFSN